jgi:predicted polyphosphate/ATP-dependent NAD kinase
MDAGAIIVLGGDGTNRVVAKGCGRVPIVPISTGTNNVFPSMIEGTVAGMAAGLVALGAVDVEHVTFQAKRLEVYLDRTLADVALVDVVTSSDLWIGTRAIWDPSHIREVVLARAEPGAIGLSSLGSCLGLVEAREEHGMYIAIGPGCTEVLAPLGPGLVAHIPIREHRLLDIGDEVALDPDSGTIALDGEREIEVYGRPEITVRLTMDGPRVVDIARCMREAAAQGFFRKE